MIGHLKGRLIQKKPNLVVVDVQGVGYEVAIPLTSFYELPGEGEEIALRIHTHVREDALALFGFHTQKEKEVFLRLIAVSGIGPKLAITILSGARVEELARAIAAADLPRLTAIPGVGRKTAERVVLELKSHMTSYLVPEEASAAETAKSDGLHEDVVSALANLGYPKAAAEKALAGVVRSGEADRNFEDILRRTLSALAG